MILQTWLSYACIFVVHVEGKVKVIVDQMRARAAAD